MAESISDLYFRLGLDITNLNSGFVNAEQTISQNLRELNNQNNLIQLKAQVELNGLDEAALSTEGLRIQQEALSQQLAIQQDRVQLTAAAYQEIIAAQGESSAAAYNLALKLEQERLAMVKLENQSRALAEQQNFALGMNWEMLGLIEPAMKLTELAAGGRNAITLLGRAIPIPQIKIASAALIGLSAAITGTIEATDELAENNAAQIMADNVKGASLNFGSALTTMRNDAITTSKAVETSFQSTSRASKTFQQQSTTFTDWARDFFRVAFLLTEESDNFADAISKVNAQSQFMRTELGEYAVVAAGIYQVFDALSRSAMSFVNPAVKEFNDLKLRADELNISLGDTNDLLTTLDLARADYNDIRDYVRGVQDAVIKGDSEDPELIALEKYGVAVQDAHGKLLPFNETLKNLYNGYLKAKEAGEAEAYVIMTNGEAVQDVLPFFENYAKALEDIAKIQWATSDFDALQKTSHSLQLMQTQMKEFDKSLQTLGLPLADFFATSEFEDYKRWTELIEENRETILYWEFVVIEAMERVQGAVDDVLDYIIGKSEETESTLESLGRKLASVFTGNYLYSFINLDDIKKQYDDAGLFYTDDDSFYNLFPEQYRDKAKGTNYYEKFNLDKYNGAGILHVDDSFFNVFPEQYRDQVKVLDLSPKESPSIFDDAKKDLEAYIEANKEAREETKKTAEEITAGLSYSYNRIKKYKEELANLEIDIKFGDDEFGKAQAKLDVWYDKAMKDAKYYAEEQEIINELYNARAEQIEKNRLEKIEEIRQNYSISRQTDLEKQLADIEREMDSWIKIGMNADEALELAENRKAQAIKQLEDEFAASTTDSHKTELEQRLAQIDKEKQAWIQKGIDEVRATQAAEQQKADAIKQLEEEWTQHINSIYQTALEQRLAQIEKEKQAWIQKGIDEVKATKAAEEQKVQAQRDAAMSVLKSQLKEYRAFQRGGYEGLRDYQLKQLYKSGIKPEDLQINQQQLALFQKAQQVAQNSLLPNFMTDNDRANQQAFRDAQFNAQQKLDADKQRLYAEQLPNIVNGDNVNLVLDNFLTGLLDKIIPQDMLGKLDLSAAMENMDTGIADLTTNITNVANAFSQIPNDFSELPLAIENVTESLQNFSTTISEIKFPDFSTAEKQPVNVNVTVQITEAHAWDSEHIQQLADKVADQIEPAIVSAIGGDSNSY